jgi:hypothetical protein
MSRRLEHDPAAVATVLPKRAARSLAWALRQADAGPAPPFRAAAFSLCATSVAGIAIALTVRPPGPLPPSQVLLIGGAVAGLCVVGVLALACALWPGPSRLRLLGRVARPEARATVWLALAAWFPLLLIPAYLKARATQPSSVVWVGYGYLDKRWESSTFLLGTLVPMLLLAAAASILSAGREHPRTWRAWLRVIFRGGAAADMRSFEISWTAVWRAAFVVTTAVALAYYFFGPPWYLDRNTTTIDYHEDVHLGGLEAISKGGVPYIGPGADQYGPGAQLLSYLYLRHVGTFSVLGVRESEAMFHWLGATIFFLALFLALGFFRGLLAALASAVVYPTLQLFGFLPGGTWSGFFGWADILRYTGTFALVLLLPGVIRRCPSRAGLVAGAGLGLLWGATAYVAQENLLGGLLGALVLSALLVLSRTSPVRGTLAALGAVLAGFALVWLPVLAYYAVEGVLGRFLSLYFLVPRAVAQGYSNSSYLEGLHSPWGRMFYTFPFALAALALLSMLRFRPFGVATGWSRDRVMLVSTLVATVVVYQGALLRSDQTHLIGTMLPVPALVVVTATTLPRLAGARRSATLVVAGAAIVAAALVLVPRTSFSWPGVKARLESPYLDRRRLAEAPPAVEPTSLAGRRIGAGLAFAPVCCTLSTASMPEFVALMNRIHSIVGDRVAYVVDFRDAYPGLVYLAADLTPAPISLEPYTMVLTAAQAEAYASDFRRRVLPQTQAVLAQSTDAPEAADFLARYPNARRVALTWRGIPYYVLVRRGATGS